MIIVIAALATGLFFMARNTVWKGEYDKLVLEHNKQLQEMETLYSDYERIKEHNEALVKGYEQEVSRLRRALADEEKNIREDVSDMSLYELADRLKSIAVDGRNRSAPEGDGASGGQDLP
jgi:hypothetical protein